MRFATEQPAANSATIDGSAGPGAVLRGAAHYLRPLLHTPFHGRASRWSQTDAMIAWSGYNTFDVFTSVEQEYFAVRNGATVYDLTPMVKYRIAGAGASRYLNHLLTRDVRRIAPGKVGYCIWCNDEGHLIDDGTLFCVSDTDYRLCTAEWQIDWLLDAAAGFEVQIDEITADYAALAFQGPTTAAILRALGLQEIESLRPFDFRVVTLRDLPLMISRTGFTGDLGYELWIAPALAEALWDLLFAGHAAGLVRPIGSRALNIARIEAGFLQPKVDFISAERTVHLDRGRSPLELGLAWQVDFGKGHFNGRRALLAEQARGPRRQLVGLDIDGNKPAINALLYADARGRYPVGSLSSATWSPSCKRNIGLAMVDSPHHQNGNRLFAEIYLNRELVWERRMVEARVVERPFFSHERRRLTPPANH